MPINYDDLISTSILDEPFEYTEKDTMLYAIGIGFADIATDRLINQIDYTPTWINGHRLV